MAGVGVTVWVCVLQDWTFQPPPYRYSYGGTPAVVAALREGMQRKAARLEVGVGVGGCGRGWW